jgi:hypothetical protein
MSEQPPSPGTSRSGPGRAVRQPRPASEFPELGPDVGPVLNADQFTPSPLPSLRGPGTSGRGDDTDGPLTKISMWGPSGSGKTTYLAALGQAVIRADQSIGRWNVFPVNEVSERQLIEWSYRLVSNQAFPDRTDIGEEIALQWLFAGDLTGSRYEQKGGWWRRRKQGAPKSRFLLDLVDVSGEVYRYDPANPKNENDIAQRALEQLAEAQGLIYLFDPVTERESRNAFDYTDSVLTKLRRKMRNDLVDNRLPQQVSVCVTKFDYAELFFQARRVGLVNYGRDGMPRVLDEHAEKFFDALCKGDFWGDDDEENHASAAAVRDHLKAYFMPERIHYYVTSSIGYWRPPGWNPESASRPGFKFDPYDFANIIMGEDGQKRIRGVIHPVNVLEPLISLQQRLAGRT